MSDQNTDRMWYVIGALVVGAGIILLANNLFPSMFENITKSFDSVADKGMAAGGELASYTDESYFVCSTNSDGETVTITDYKD